MRPPRSDWREQVVVRHTGTCMSRFHDIFKASSEACLQLHVQSCNLSACSHRYHFDAGSSRTESPTSWASSLAMTQALLSSSWALATIQNLLSQQRLACQHDQPAYHKALVRVLLAACISPSSSVPVQYQLPPRSLICRLAQSNVPEQGQACWLDLKAHQSVCHWHMHRLCCSARSGAAFVLLYHYVFVIAFSGYQLLKFKSMG